MADTSDMRSALAAFLQHEAVKHTIICKFARGFLQHAIGCAKQNNNNDNKKVLLEVLGFGEPSAQPPLMTHDIDIYSLTNTCSFGSPKGPVDVLRFSRIISRKTPNTENKYSRARICDSGWVHVSEIRLYLY